MSVAKRLIKLDWCIQQTFKSISYPRSYRLQYGRLRDLRKRQMSWYVQSKIGFTLMNCGQSGSVMVKHVRPPANKHTLEKEHSFKQHPTAYTWQFIWLIYIFFFNVIEPHAIVGKFWKEGNVWFNDAFNTFYLLLYGIRHMVKDHSDSKRGNLLPPHGLLIPISSKVFFYMHHPIDRITGWNEKWVHHERLIRWPIAVSKCSYHGATSRSLNFVSNIHNYHT